MAWWGLGVVRGGSGELGAIGEIVGVYRQVLTEGVLPMALSQSACPNCWRRSVLVMASI